MDWRACVCYFSYAYGCFKKAVGAIYLSVKSLFFVVGMFWKGSGSFKDCLACCPKDLITHSIEFQKKVSSSVNE